MESTINLGKQESNLRRDRPTWVRLLDQVKSFVCRSEAELPVEQNDVVGVDLRTGREQLHREQVAGERDIDNQRIA
jgi:hypothetical protein